MAAASCKNLQLLFNPFGNHICRAFSFKLDNILIARHNCARLFHQTSLFQKATLGISPGLSRTQGAQGMWLTYSREYHTGQPLSIKASQLSLDKPLIKADVGCPICSANVSFTYKDVLFLAQFLSPEGNLMSKRLTGVCGKQQKRLEKTIKISRRLGLLPKCGPVSPVVDQLTNVN